MNTDTQNRRKTHISIIIGVLLFFSASYLAYISSESSWFALLIVYTFYSALFLTPTQAVLLGAGFSVYTSLFSFYILRADFTVELGFVILVWLLAAYFPSKMKQNFRRFSAGEALHRGILEASPHGIIRTDLQGTITFCNPKQLELVGGKSKDELIGKNAFDFIVPKQRERAHENLKKLLEKGSQHNMMYTAFKLDGSTFEQELSTAVTYDEHHKPSGFIGIVRDITRERDILHLNEERRLYLEAILDSSVDAILTLDTENNIKEWNLGAEKLFHYSKEEALGRNLDTLLAGGTQEVLEDAQELTDRVNQGLQVPPTETRRYTKEGEAIDVIVSGAPIIVEKEFRGIVATYTDITQQKRAEEKVQNLLDEKERLLQEVHHRIKNHMTTLSSIVLLNSYASDDPKVKEVLEEVNSRIKIMQNIYQGLYTSENLDSVKISTYIEQLLHDLRDAYVYDEKISILTDIEEISVTPKQSLPIGIIVNELVTNSLKYAYPDTTGGTIYVSVHRRGEDLITIQVRDDGQGLASGTIEKSEYGFGLTLVDGYTTQFNGELDIGRHNDRGTEITVTIEIEN